MRFHELSIPDAYWIEFELREDERGFFARSFCVEEFEKHGLPSHFPQENISFNKKKGTLRGMHYSVEPAAEEKLVRCTQGAVFDVLVDLRPTSPSYLKWVSVELSQENRKVLFIPKGVAHGFQTLEENTELLYHMSVPYDPSCARGIHYNSAEFNIEWPLPNPTLSEKDALLPETVSFSHAAQ